jgi:hypothetical protein
MAATPDEKVRRRKRFAGAEKAARQKPHRRQRSRKPVEHRAAWRRRLAE